jgi:PAS domain-containing protein
MSHKPRIVVGPDGRIALVNQHAQRMLGYDERELVGRSSEALLSEEHRELHVRARDAFLAEPAYDAGPLDPGESALLGRGGAKVLAWLWPQPLVQGDRLWLSLTLCPPCGDCRPA